MNKSSIIYSHKFNGKTSVYNLMFRQIRSVHLVFNLNFKENQLTVTLCTIIDIINLSMITVYINKAFYTIMYDFRY